MANTGSLLVLALALVVFGGDLSKFGVGANTASILPGKEPLIGGTGTSTSPQHNTRPQPHHTQFSQTTLNAPGTSIQPLLPSSSLPSLSRSSPVQQPQPSLPSSSSTQQHPQQRSVAPHNNVNAPSIISGKNGFGFRAGSYNGGPSTSGYGYISGRTLDQPSYRYMKNDDSVERSTKPSTRPYSILSGLQGLTPNFGDFFHSGVDFKSAMVGAVLGSGATYFASGGKFSGLFPYMREAVVELKNIQKVASAINGTASYSPASNGTASFRPASNGTALPGPASDPITESGSDADAGSSRRRRDADFDTDLAELATVVLSAIQSGECMQRSICLLGSRIGSTDKGKIGFILVDKLIPESVQGSQYFITLKKALRGGESYCDRFRCKFN